MIVLTRGNILVSSAQTLVVPVNTEGVMGKGLAEQFKRGFPEVYPAYKRACRDRYFARHRNFLYPVKDKIILCMPTKTLWRYPSKIEWIETAVKDIALNYEKYGITELAIPPVGCGEGNLPWESVKPLLYKYLDPLPITVQVYVPPHEVLL